MSKQKASDYLKPKVQRKQTSFRAKPDVLIKVNKLAEMLGLHDYEIWEAAAERFHDEILKEKK